MTITTTTTTTIASTDDPVAANRTPARTTQLAALVARNLRTRRPDIVQFAGMMVMMPLMFVSSAFAPLDTMPGWMRALANANPVSHATDALRGAVLGTATGNDILSALVAATAMWVIVAAVPTSRR